MDMPQNIQEQLNQFQQVQQQAQSIAMQKQTLDVYKRQILYIFQTK